MLEFLIGFSIGIAATIVMAAIFAMPRHREQDILDDEEDTETDTSFKRDDMWGED